MANDNYVLEAREICKSFSGVKVLDHAGLTVLPGEVHALMGENGAGKSTLMKIIMGIYTKDSGSIVMNGQEVEFKGPSDALYAGISMIHQELSPIPEMTVAENIFLGREKRKIKGLPFMDRKAVNSSTMELLERYEMAEYIKPTMKMKTLNIAQIQMVEIIKAVSYDSKILIMDEPTSSLSDKESEVLFKIIENLRSQQVGIIYISHRMAEVFQISDRISVLRDGNFIGCVETESASHQKLINMMVGRELERGYPQNTAEKGEVVLELKDMCSEGVFENFNLSVRSGEILGLAGLVGAGRSEVMQALVGYDPLDSGEIYLEGEKIEIHHPSDAIKNHIIIASEDRKELGLVFGRSIRENVALQNLEQVSTASFLNKPLEKKLCNSYAKEMTIKMNSIEEDIGSLSGGNQQKAVLAKSLMSKPKVLIMDEPTRGIDVGAKSTIYNIMIDLAKQGIAIIMISSELPELIGMADRILVMSGGKIMGELTDKKEFSQHKILSMAFGGVLNES
ncbi:MAG: sugar ABC transporter ATP-binding protein [Sphaerochaetaceae bacterium]|nr:sugar ABC transporter ATP-binding protein [Sphaerochaetaceae bacterium]